MAGLAGCMAPDAPSVVGLAIGLDPAGEWRTADGHALSTAELAALRDACGPQPFAAWFDSEQRAAPRYRDSPALHAGGLGLSAAPPSGVGALDDPTALTVIRRQTLVLQPLDECLAEKGVVRQPAIAALPPPTIVPPPMPAPEAAPPHRPRHPKKARHKRRKRHMDDTAVEAAAPPEAAQPPPAEPERPEPPPSAAKPEPPPGAAKPE